MTALTQSKSRPVRLASTKLNTRVLQLAGYTLYGGGTTAHTVYKGSVVGSDVSETDGYFHAPVAIGTTAAAGGDLIGGIALEEVDVTSVDLADGSKKVTVAVDGIWGFAVGSLAITDLGAPAYAQDDDSVTASSTNAWWIGTMVDIDATYIWVDISHACGRANTAT